MAFSIVFPGQGSQSVGMLAELAHQTPVVEDTFAQASEALGYDLWKLTQTGPEALLGQTERTQPALLTSGVAVYRAWRAAGGPVPMSMAGHSLGEYTALVCAGRMDFGVAVALVRDRGKAMQEAVPIGEGTMAAILGLDDQQVAEACAAAAQGQVVSPANYNSPGQIVIAGHAGARRAGLLDVSIPAHCELMRAAADELARRLGQVRIEVGESVVFHNVDAHPRDTDDEVRTALIQQLYQPVRWSDSVRAMAARGAVTFIEMGPGKVLTGLMRRIDRDLAAAACCDPASLAAALSMIQTEET
jgi:[acyl-carrier-protein] S-malonyltransferase